MALPGNAAADGTGEVTGRSSRELTPDRWREIDDALQRLADLDPASRQALAAGTRNSDLEPDLHLRMLAEAMVEGADFLESPITSGLLAEPPITPEAPVRIGPWRIVRSLGEGGMGAVYLAARDDGAYEQQAALKLMRQDFGSAAMLRRFRRERQILASLDHPNIARLLDGGATDQGAPYLAMEYVEGLPVTTYCRQASLSISERLRIFYTICAAAHSAHQRLVIHLDIKPGNILVTGEGIPKLLDFGIARLLDRGADGATDGVATMLRPLTPDYASPEQIRGEMPTVASDIYSLGALLYELLTGERAFRLAGMSLPEMEQAKLHQPSLLSHLAGPPSGGKGRPRFAGDLENIVRMAMHPDASRRYASADQLAQDVRRYLNMLPVIACKDSVGYRLGKFLRRHRTGSAAAAVATLAMVAGFAGTVWQAHVAARQRTIAEAARNEAERRLDDTLGLTHTLLFDYNDAIAGLSGSTAVRMRLVNDTLEYLDHLAQRSAGNLPLQHQLGLAYLKIGDVQGKPYASNLGDTAGAMWSYRRAVALLQPIASEEPQNHDVQLDLCRAYHAEGVLLVRVLDYDAALRILHKVTENAGHLSAADTANRETQQILASTWHTLGDVSAYRQNLVEAHDDYARAAEIWNQLAAADPANPKFRRAWATTQERLGGVYQDSAIDLQDFLHDDTDARKDWMTALAYYRAGLNAAERLAAQYPHDARLQRTAADIATYTAHALGAVGQTQQALDLQRHAIRTFSVLSASDPENRESKFDLLDARCVLALILAKAGQLRPALDLYRQSIAEGKILLRADPGDKEWRLYFATRYRASYVPLAMRVDPAMAVQVAREALAFQAESAALDPSEVQWRTAETWSRMQLAAAMEKAGRAGESRRTALATLAQARRFATRPGAVAQDLRIYGAILLECRPASLRNPPQALHYLQLASQRDGQPDARLAVSYFLNGETERAMDMARAIAHRIPWPAEARDTATLRRDLEAQAAAMRN